MKRRVGGWLRALVAASLALSFLGIIEAPTASAALTRTSTTSGVIYGGDWYDSPATNPTLNCASGSVVTAISSHNTLAANEYYSTALAIQCTALNQARELTGNAVVHESALATTANKHSSCSSGNAANAIRINIISSIASNSKGNSQWVVNSGVNCVKTADRTGAEEVALANDNRATSYGSRAVTTYTSSCQTGSFLVGVEYESGGGLHELRALCASFQMDQSALAVSTTTGTYLTSLTLGTTGGSGNGSVTYSYSQGTTTCTLLNGVLTSAGAGTCLITAAKAASTDYNAAVSSVATIIFDRANQSITLSSIGATTKAYPYSQTLNITTTGTLGSGAISYAVSDVSATGCALSDTATATPLLTATTSGTCSIVATIAQDLNYISAQSPGASFAFVKANQSAISITSTAGVFGTPLTLSVTGGSNSEAITYSYVAGSTTCSLNSGVLTAAGAGTCKITATRATDINYNSVISSEAIVTFVRGAATATLTFPAGDFVYRELKSLTVITSAAGKLTFRSNRKLIPGCNNLKATAGNSFQVSCSYKPSTHGSMKISVTFDPTNPDFIGTTTVTRTYYVLKRSTVR